METKYTKEQIFEAARYMVNEFGIEPVPGKVANELSIAIFPGVLDVSIEGRGRGKGSAIVRFRGEVVANESPLQGTLVEGEWINLLMDQYAVAKRIDSQVEGVPV